MRAAREARLAAQSEGLERVESGALRCKGRDPNVRPLNPSEWRSGAHESITPAAAAAAAAAAAGGAAAAAARLAAELGRGKAAGEDGEGGEGDARPYTAP